MKYINDKVYAILIAVYCLVLFFVGRSGKYGLLQFLMILLMLFLADVRIAKLFGKYENIPDLSTVVTICFLAVNFILFFNKSSEVINIAIAGILAVTRRVEMLMKNYKEKEIKAEQ